MTHVPVSTVRGWTGLTKIERLKGKVTVAAAVNSMPPDSPTQEDKTYRERQKKHFRRLLEENWGCKKPGHNICVVTKDRQEFTLTERIIDKWIEFLCDGKCTTAAPPPGTYEDINHGPVWNHTDGTMTVEAVEIPPCRHEAIRVSSSLYTRSTRESIARWSLNSSYTGSSSTSHDAPGPGHHAARALTWLGDAVVSRMEDVATSRRAGSHLKTLKTWRAEVRKIGINERVKVVIMLADALSMSLPSFSSKIREMSFQIGKAVQAWLAAVPDLQMTRDNALVLVQVQTCILPLILNKISRTHPVVADLAWQLTDALLRAPLGVIDFDLMVPDSDTNRILKERSDTPSIAITIVTRELAYSNCSDQHPWLGLHLLRLVETTLRLRKLTVVEMSAIWELAERRAAKFQAKGDLRAWEIPLFAICSDENPDFRSPVLDPTGVPSLINGLKSMLSLPLDHTPWDSIVLTVRSLTFISEHKWIVEEGVLGEDAIQILVMILRLSIPKSAFPMHYWAIDTLRNIISHAPSMARILIQHDLEEPISFVISTDIEYPHLHRRNVSDPENTAFPPRTFERNQSFLSSPNSESFPGSTSRRRPSTASSTSTSEGRDHRLEKYLYEATIRAEELSTRVKEWNKFTPEALPRIGSTTDLSSDWRSSILLDDYLQESLPYEGERPASF